jgi:hypothetical protein
MLNELQNCYKKYITQNTLQTLDLCGAYGFLREQLKIGFKTVVVET